MHDFKVKHLEFQELLFFFKLLEDKEKLLEKELQERLHKMEADKLAELERKEQRLYDRMQGESPDDRYVILP